MIRYKLPVHYVSTGQKVPENLYVAHQALPDQERVLHSARSLAVRAA